MAAVNNSGESCSESNSFQSDPSSFIFSLTKDTLDKLNFKCLKFRSTCVRADLAAMEGRVNLTVNIMMAVVRSVMMT